MSDLHRIPPPTRHTPWRHDTQNPDASVSEAECHVCVLYAHYDRDVAQLREHIDGWVEAAQRDAARISELEAALGSALIGRYLAPKESNDD